MADFYRVSPTLWRYLGWRYAKSVFFTTLAFGIFSYLLDVMEHMRRLGDIPEAGAATAFYLSALKLPALTLELTPFIILLATLLSFFTLTKNHELISLRSIGLPARRFVLPAVCVMLLIAACNVLLLSNVAAVFQKMYERKQAEIFPDITQGLITKQGELWLRQPGKNVETGETEDTFLYAKHVDTDGTHLKDVTLFTFNAKGTFQHRMDVAEMTYQYTRQRFTNSVPETYWQLESVYHFRPQAAAAATATVPPPAINASATTLTQAQPVDLLPPTHLQWTAEEIWKTHLTPETIANSTVSPQTMPLWEVYPFIQTLKEAGLPTQQHELYFHRQVAMPAFLMGMFLLAVPFGLRFARNQGLGKILILGLGLGFTFFIFTEIVAGYGLASRLNPILAAWAPAAVAALVGIGLLVFYREE